MSSRRKFLKNVIAAAASLGGASRLLSLDRPQQVRSGRKDSPARLRDTAPVPVVTRDLGNLPFTIENGVKVFQLTAEPVKRKIAPWKTIDCWGFNGSCPGPTIQVNQGDRVRLILE